MSDDPVRLLEEGGSTLVRTLLSAAREEEPDAAAMRRTLAAVGVGVALTAAASASTASAAASAGTASTAAASSVAVGAVKSAAVPTLVIVGKWLAVGIVVGAVGSTTVYGVSGVLSPAASVAPRARAAPAETREKPPAPPLREAQSEPILPAPVLSASNASWAPSPPAPLASSAKTSPTDSLAQEVATLDSARQALASGNAGGALAALNGYERRFPAAGMLPEALYLRLQAFTLKGDKASAEGVARQILQRYPSSPHAAHARAVLGSAAAP